MKLLLSQDAEIFATFEWQKDKWAISTKNGTILNWWKDYTNFFEGFAAIFTWESIGYDVLIVNWADWDNYKNEFIWQEHSILKSKIYLKPQEKPPEGIRMQRGPRGGSYYETETRIAPIKVPDLKNLHIDEIIRRLPTLSQNELHSLIADKRYYIRSRIIERLNQNGLHQLLNDEDSIVRKEVAKRIDQKGLYQLINDKDGGIRREVVE